MYLMDGTRQIMISKAINESDRLSSCHKGMRRWLEKRELLFNVFSFKTIDDADTGGIPEEFLLRYNIGGIHISAAAFDKLCTEISLQEFDLKVPMIWKTSAVRFYSGMVPLGHGMFHRIIIREGRIAHVDARDFSLKEMTDLPYYEICIHPRIYEAIESFQTGNDVGVCEISIGRPTAALQNAGLASLNGTRTTASTSTGVPFRVPGRNLHFSSASRAFSSRRASKPSRMRTSPTVPSLRMMAYRVTVPCTRSCIIDKG